MTEIIAGTEAAYRDSGRPTRQRVDDLLARLTTEEKVAQLGSAWVFQVIESGSLSPAKATDIMGGGIGQITRVSGASGMGSREAAHAANEIQRFLVEETRLGIPAILHEEVCAGLMARQATVFPQAIGVAGTFDAGLVERMADVIRNEMRALGIHQGLAPVLDVCRDPRWGRTEETYGEDPHLVATMGCAFVRGLQANDWSRGVVATAKHFVGYGASEGGLNWAPAHIPPRELHEIYLHPFEAAVRDAGLGSVMNGYHELDGVPCAANGDLLTGLLRERWDFDGVVVADYFSVRQLAEYHRLVPDAAEAAATALTAGIDVELPGADCYAGPLLEAMRSGSVAPAVVDDAVRRVLTAKFDLGLFESPYVEEERAADVVGAVTHRELAGEIARSSMVLLRNDGTLPLAPDVSAVAVIGPNADEGRNLLSDYSYRAHVDSLREMSVDNIFSIPIDGPLDLGDDVPVPSVLDAMRDRFGSAVRHAPGCDVGGRSTHGFAEAVELAATSDVVVMVMGDKAGLTDDCTSGESRDRSSLDLPGIQEQLVEAVLDTGTPVVLVLVAGRPCGSPAILERCAAVVMAWLPGAEGAAAIADVLTGEANPGGKLPITFPRHSGQVPVFYAHKVSGGRSHWKGDYVDSPAAPLYPFGFGLSYTSFEIDPLAVTPAEVTAEGAVEVSATITNTGDRAGDEVVQLYTRDIDATVTRPVLELKGFCRVTVPAGESRTVTFELPVGQVGFHGRDLGYLVEPGVIEVFVGRSSTDVVAAGAFTITTSATGDSFKAFGGSVRVS
jgi:beta-glucosidase